MAIENRRKYQAEEIFENVADSIVSIRTTKGSGSGVLIDSRGIVATNKHVVEKNKYVLIGFKDKTYIKGKVLRSYLDTDLAFIRADLSSLPMNSSLLLAFSSATKTLKFQRSDPRVGESIFAIGHPLGLDYTLTKGIISATKRIIDSQEYLQIDASINPGNSGGGLYNAYGELIGINTMGYAETQGINFAIPISLIREKYEDLLSDVKQGYTHYCTVCGFSSKTEKYCENCGSRLDSDENSDEFDEIIKSLNKIADDGKEKYTLRSVKCGVCGTEAPQNATYCNGCGSKL